MTSAEDLYLFRHAIVRDAAYRLQPPSERAEMHVAVLDIQLALHGGAPPVTMAGELAEHAGAALEAGLDTPRLRELRVQFLEQAMLASADGFRLSETIDFARQLSSLEWISPKKCVTALLTAAEYSDRAGKREQAEHYVRAGLQRLESAPHAMLSFRAYMLQAVIRIHQGNYVAAEEALSALVAMDSAEISEFHHSMALGNLAIVHREIGQNDKAEAEYRQVIECLQRLGDQGEQGRNLGNLANLLRDKGKFEEAEAAFLESIELVRAAADTMTEGIVLGNYAEFLITRERYPEARGVIAAARAIQQKLGDTEGEAQAQSHLSRVLEGEGDLPGAIRTAREAIAQLIKAESPLLAAGARYHLASMLLRSGDLKGAERESGQSEQTLTAMGARELLLCHVIPLRLRIGVLGGGDLSELAARLAESESELKRLSLGPQSVAAQSIAVAREELAMAKGSR